MEVGAPAIFSSFAVRPPCELVLIRVDLAERVDIAGCKQFIHPLAFLGQKARYGAITLGVLHIAGTVGDMPVAADYELPALVANFLQVGTEQRVKFVFALL